jgi:hypothetical protein
MERGRELGELDERERERERALRRAKNTSFRRRGEERELPPSASVGELENIAELPSFPHIYSPFFSPPIFFCFVGGSSYPIDYLHSSDDINILE